jgi:type II secretory pathway component PulF
MVEGFPMSDYALSRTTFWLLLLVHCLAGVVLFATLVGLVPKFESLLEGLDDHNQLPRLTVFALFLSRYWYLLLLSGSVVDVVVLHLLSRLTRKRRWLSVAWFGLVLLTMVVLLVLITFGLLAPTREMSVTN